MVKDTGITDGSLPLLRLLQLVSPSLPIGGFAYSQGIEWAVEAGWIRSAEQLQAWLLDQLGNPMADLDLPLLIRLYDAARVRDRAAMVRWIDWLLAARETSELRAEEANRGRALADLLIVWELAGARDWKTTLARSQAAGFAFAAAAWEIPVRNAALGYAGVGWRIWHWPGLNSSPSGAPRASGYSNGRRGDSRSRHRAPGPPR